MPRWHLYLGLSVAVHAAVALIFVARPAAPRKKQIPLEVAVVMRPPPPRPPEPEPPAAPPPPPKSRPPPRPRAARPALPPPPSMKAPEPTPEPEVVSGVTPDSTAAGGSFAVPTGNTLYAPPPSRAPEEVKPYAAEQYAPAATLSEMPRLVAQPDLRRFYPAEARRKEREAAVVLRLWLDASGAVTRAEIVSNPGDGLGEAALRAAPELRFSPARLQGQPVATSVPFTLHFVLR